MSDSSNFIEFSRKNSLAIGFFNHASHDYLAARTCLLNGLFSGLQLGSQAIEKTMKGILKLSGKPMKYGHDLTKLNNALKDANLAAAFDDDSTLKSFLAHYERRYPDDREPAIAVHSRMELDSLDQLMLHLVLNAPNNPARWRCGVPAFLCDLAWDLAPSHWSQVLLIENKAFQPEIPNLIKEIKIDTIPPSDAKPVKINFTGTLSGEEAATLFRVMDFISKQG